MSPEMQARADAVDKKLDAIHDALLALGPSAKEHAELSLAVNSLRDKISKLHSKKYEGKELSASQISDMVGVLTREKGPEENRMFWNVIKLDLVRAILRLEGFPAGNEGFYKVGE